MLGERASLGRGNSMEIRADEISKIIREQIKDYGKRLSVAETGTVLSVGDGITRIYGLDAAESGELVEFANGVKGLVLNLEEDNVGVAVMGEYQEIREGDTVKRTGQIASVPVGRQLLGRVVNALGAPIDGKGPIEATEFRKLEIKAPGIVKRKSVHQPARRGCLLFLRRDRSKTVDRGPGSRQAQALRSNGLHHGRECNRFGPCANAILRSVRWRHDGRISPRQQDACADRL